MIIDGTVEQGALGWFGVEAKGDLLMKTGSKVQGGWFQEFQVTGSASVTMEEGSNMVTDHYTAFWFQGKSTTMFGPNTYLEGSRLHYVLIEEGVVSFGQSTQVKMAYLTWIHLIGTSSRLGTGASTEINLGTSSTLSLNDATLTTSKAAQSQC